MGVRSAKAACTLGVMFVFLLTAVTWAAPISKPVTVGHFVERLARHLGFQPSNAPNARALLAEAGVTFRAGLEDPLTEGAAEGLLSDLGVEAAASSDPSKMLSGAFADRLAGMVSRTILTDAAMPPPGPKGSLPPSCTSLERSQCFQCCLASLGPIASVPQRMLDLCSNSCTLLGAPPSSPSGP
jgi:hypothetical protein